MNQLINIFKIFSDKNRVLIFKIILNNQKICVCDIAKITNLKRNLISHHLKMLEKTKLIKHEKKGRYIYYYINNPFLQKLKNLLCNFLKNEKNP